MWLLIAGPSAGAVDSLGGVRSSRSTMKEFNVGVLKAGFTGVSPVVLMMQMLKFKVLGFDADRVFVAVRALTDAGAEQKVMQDAKAQFGVEVKAFSYGVAAA